ncbi:MAG: hypothetical protein NT027_04485 [Proteobacteria bacterium]|nr:hypothetical protein [Pseudomonadota bacterium]
MKPFVIAFSLALFCGTVHGESLCRQMCLANKYCPQPEKPRMPFDIYSPDFLKKVANGDPEKLSEIEEFIPDATAYSSKLITYNQCMKPVRICLASCPY